MRSKRRLVDLRLAEKEEERDRIIGLSARGKLPEDNLKAQLDRLDIQMGELRLERMELYEGELEKEAIVSIGVKFMASASKMWVSSDLADRQRFQRMVFPYGLTYIFGKGFGTVKLEACFEEARLIKAKKQELLKTK